MLNNTLSYLFNILCIICYIAINILHVHQDQNSYELLDHACSETAAHISSSISHLQESQAWNWNIAL